MLKQGSRSLAWLLALSLIAVACGDDDDDTTGTGGKASTGGSKSTTGGSKSTTGGTSSGGSSPKGGTTNGGSSGGTVTSGGTGTGGTATGGVTTGGVSTGGTSTGGVAGGGGEGGMPEGGTSGGDQGGGGGIIEGGSAGAAPTGGTAGAETGGSGGTAGGDSIDGGAGGSGGETTVLPDVIDNPKFDVWSDADPLPNWTKSGPDLAASFKEWKPGVGAVESFVLSNWSATAFEVATSQLVSPLPNGNYSLSIWHKGAVFITQRIFARGHDVNNPSAELVFDVGASADWAQAVLTPIPITSGHVEIGIYSKGAAEAWSHFDDVTLTKLP